MNMLRKLVAAYYALHRLAITQNVKVVVSEVDQTTPGHGRDRAVVDIPLHRHGPVEYRSPTRNLIDRQIDMASDETKRLANASACETAIDRKQLRDQTIEVDSI
jgi:hypothetical protein